MDNEHISQSVPASWQLVPIQSAFRFTVKPRDLLIRNTPSIPFLPMERIPIGEVFVSDFEMRKPDEISSGTYFEDGDLLVAKITPSFENGKQAVVEKLPGKFGVATTEVIPIRGIPGKSETLFLHYYLQRPDVRAELAGKMTGTTGRQRLDKDTLENYRIMLPSLPEQREIVRVLSTILGAQQAAREKFKAMQALYQTLLHELLNGKIRLPGQNVEAHA